MALGLNLYYGHAVMPELRHILPHNEQVDAALITPVSIQQDLGDAF